MEDRRITASGVDGALLNPKGGYIPPFSSFTEPLCEGCQSVVASLQTVSSRYELSYVCASACPLCLFVRKKILGKFSIRPYEAADSTSHRQTQSFWLSGDLSLHVDGGIRTSDGYQFYISATMTRLMPQSEALGSTGSPKSGLLTVLLSRDAVSCISQPQMYLRMPGTSNACPESTFSPPSISCIRSWLSACDEKHSCMKSKSKSGRSPSRLLDLGIFTDKVSLVRPSQEREDGAWRYVTLSHCWGDFVPVKLLDKNMQHFCEGYPIQLLPPTFQDAIKLTKALAIRYLLIDALCIIQDSIEDWSKEASLMHEVFTECYINIAATASIDSSKGLFRTRPAGFTEPCLIGAPNVEVPNVALPHRHWSTYCCFDKHHWWAAIDEAPLNSRAWVLQERLLSPRTLHFAGMEVFWECRAQRACETFPTGLPPECIVDIPKGLENLILDGRTRRSSSEWQTALPPVHSSETVQRWDWRSLVEKYTHCQMTYSSDRTVAIHALAKGMQLQWGLDAHDYIAGLWRDALVVHLLWMRDPIYKAEVRVPDVPTWSWYSITAGIEFETGVRHDRWKQCCHVREICRRSGEDPFGSVQHIRLSLCAPLLRFSVAKQPEDEHWTSRVVALFSDCRIYIHLDLDAIVDDSFYIMPLGMVQVGPLWNGDPADDPIEALVVRPQSGASDVFMRAGYCTAFDSSNNHRHVNDPHVLYIDAKFGLYESINDESTWRTIHLI